MLSYTSGGWPDGFPLTEHRLDGFRPVSEREIHRSAGVFFRCAWPQAYVYTGETSYTAMGQVNRSPAIYQPFTQRLQCQRQR